MLLLLAVFECVDIAHNVIIMMMMMMSPIASLLLLLVVGIVADDDSAPPALTSKLQVHVSLIDCSNSFKGRFDGGLLR